MTADHSKPAQPTEPDASVQASRPVSVQELVAQRNWQTIVRLGPAAVDALMAALTDPAVQAEAAEALGAIRHQGALAPLVRLLAADESLVRWSAAEALGRLGNPGAVAPLVAALADANQFVRDAAASALTVLAWEPPDEPARARVALAARKWQEAVACGHAAVPEALRLLEDSDAGIRADAARGLGQLGHSDAVAPLAARLQDEHGEVRARAADALGTIADAWAVDPLIAALQDPEPAVREAAASALARIGPAAVHPLVVLFKKRRAARDVVELLSHLVEAHAPHLAEDDLRTLVLLRDADKVVVSGEPADGRGAPVAWGVRYLPIRRNAKRELARRGIAA